MAPPLPRSSRDLVGKCLRHSTVSPAVDHCLSLTLLVLTKYRVFFSSGRISVRGILHAITAAPYSTDVFQPSSDDDCTVARSPDQSCRACGGGVVHRRVFLKCPVNSLSIFQTMPGRFSVGYHRYIPLYIVLLTAILPRRNSVHSDYLMTLARRVVKIRAMGAPWQNYWAIIHCAVSLCLSPLQPTQLNFYGGTPSCPDPNSTRNNLCWHSCYIRDHFVLLRV